MKFWLEETAEKIMVTGKSTFEHNHELAQTRAERAVYRATRDKISESDLETARMMRAAGALNPNILAFLKDLHTTTDADGTKHVPSSPSRALLMHSGTPWGRSSWTRRIRARPPRRTGARLQGGFLPG